LELVDYKQRQGDRYGVSQPVLFAHEHAKNGSDEQGPEEPRNVAVVDPHFSVIFVVSSCALRFITGGNMLISEDAQTNEMVM
jgi:hypothetical protein